MSQLADHERQKKRQYADRINRVDRGSFTPLVFATNGMCSTETTVFLRTLAARIHDRHRDLPYSLLVRQLRSRISLCLVRWHITCLRGARVSYVRRHAGGGAHNFVMECRACANLLT
eukprot:scpid87910/ scgid21556/ 